LPSGASLRAREKKIAPMAKPSTKTTRAATNARKRVVLEHCGSRFCAGYEVIVKFAPVETSSFGRTSKARGQGERS
jgi:hypothetical protein